MDAFDSALAITKANGRYSEIFAPELSSGARMSSSPPSVLYKNQPSFFFINQYSSPWIVLPIRAFSRSLHARQAPSWIPYSAVEPFVVSKSTMYISLTVPA
jgi:hypothetical protein